MAYVDVRMPNGWDGIETISRIWQEFPELQVVICTAFSDYSWEEIQERLGHSDRFLILKKPFDNLEVRQLTFETPDLDAFPCLRLAFAAGRAGGGAPAVLSGANEVAVAAFLEGRIAWTAIASIVAEVLDGGTGNVDDVADVLEADRVARERATAAVDRLARAA